MHTIGSYSCYSASRIFYAAFQLVEEHC